MLNKRIKFIEGTIFEKIFKYQYKSIRIAGFFKEKKNPSFSQILPEEEFRRNPDINSAM